MTTVTTVAAKVLAPDAATKAGSTASLRLVASTTGEAAGLDPGTLGLLQGTREAAVPSHGLWVESLRPNPSILPEGTYYQLVTQVKGRGSVVSNFIAPASPPSGTLTSAATLSTSSAFTLAIANAGTVFATASQGAPKLVVIGGVVVQYTGQTSSSLTGCTTYTAGASPYAIGTVVEQAYWVGDILTDPPSTLPSVPLNLHLLDPLDAHDASAISVSPAVADEDDGQAVLSVLELRNAATIGRASLDPTLGLVVDVATPWGIGADGPYWDPGNVTAGEEALFHIEPDGTASWVLVSEVH